MNQKLTELKEVIIKANPSIKDLVFGCEVEYRSSGYGMGNWIITKYLYDDKYRLGKLDDGDEDMDFSYNFIEVIGRPIRLSDVLLATGATDKELIRNKGVVVNDEGDITIIEHLGENKVVCISEIVRWNLKDDNLDNNPQCWDFLHSLLVKK